MKKYKHTLPLLALLLFSLGTLWLGSTPNVQLSPCDPVSAIIPIPAIAIFLTLALFVILLVKRKNEK